MGDETTNRVSKRTDADRVAVLRRVKTTLQDHQIERLKGTYEDLTRNPRYREMASFFFTDLYQVGDFRERNESFLRLYKHLERVLGLKILHGLKALMDFYFISERLDGEIAILLERMGVGLTFTSQQYEQAYRTADNHQERVIQLEVCRDSLDFVHHMSHLPLFGGFIKSCQITARIIGARAMVEFLGRGYRVFKDVPDIAPFRDIIQTRERERLDRIWRDYQPDPRLALSAEERTLAEIL